MAELGLNEHHHTTVLNYMRFSRYKRGQNLRVVDGCFEDLKDSRLTEDTFTVDEVSEMLDGLEAVVRGEVETELINTAHTNVLLLRQLFQQAEKWHLKLQTDISELENRELIELIQDIEEREFSGKPSGKPTFDMKKLSPLESGGAELLQNEIERLTEENEKLKGRLRSAELAATGVLKDKSALASDLERAQDEMRGLRGRHGTDRSGDIAELEGQMSNVRMQLEKNLHDSSKTQSELKEDLTSTKHRLLEIQEQLEMAEKELERKFSQTGAYKNMKKMLEKKNELIKDLRKRLRKYEDDD
ncbi:leucine zipper transcription factor-like protein 1 [Saccoglossus kowalevskii]|uniref:Leucine zipper transcription factor-like protein 1 n=1 Tax=Saccoglossus kowalevskii TaxID=10224 RepID=A0ABM0MNH9_SACKO|nr:PREDICTED: leucine zipper transcription factor-like protein 1-like [Saccoglossus kowalevskii]